MKWEDNYPLLRFLPRCDVSLTLCVVGQALHSHLIEHLLLYAQGILLALGRIGSARQVVIVIELDMLVADLEMVVDLSPSGNMEYAKPRHGRHVFKPT